MTKVNVTASQKMDMASLGLDEVLERELKVLKEEEDNENEDGKEDNSK